MATALIDLHEEGKFHGDVRYLMAHSRLEYVAIDPDKKRFVLLPWRQGEYAERGFPAPELDGTDEATGTLSSNA